MADMAGSALFPVAFQAIADIHTGQSVGYEVLARPDLTYHKGDVADYFATCSDLDALTLLEISVRRQAARQAEALPDLPNRLLFINIDARLAGRSAPVVEAGLHFLSPFTRQLVSEITSASIDNEVAQKWVNQLRDHRGLVALDHFGEMPRGMSFLLHCEIDFLKIPRTLITGVDRVARQRVMLAQLVATAHTLGLQVIAVGIETATELQICRELGCDMAQGNFIQPPMQDAKGCGVSFDRVVSLARDERKHRLVDHKWIEEQLDATPPLPIDTPMKEVFALVAKDPSRTLLPVVDHNGLPLGMVREQALRNHVYSTYGKELIANRSLGFSLRSFIERSPIAALSTPLDRLLGLYSTNEHADGIIITDHNRYLGFLSARSIIRAMHEKTLARARDENPLTKLPGNALINEFVADLLRNRRPAIIVYLYFDHFKPFNDLFGFRQGDRAILLFADLLRALAPPTHCFIGHIGGDDFFVGLIETALADAEALIAAIIGKFALDAESFYDAETRQLGFMTAPDRDGILRQFPLLSVSAVLLVIDEHAVDCTPDDVSRALANSKKLAKSAVSRRAVARLHDRSSAFSDLALG
jgi:diguanylate cyclase (GGDEF)-like protein